MNDVDAVSIMCQFAEKIRYYGESLKESLPNYGMSLINISKRMDECLQILKGTVDDLNEYRRQESMRLNGIEEDTLAPESWGWM